MTMYAFMYLLAFVAIGAIVLWTLDKANQRSKTRACPMCRSRVDKRAFVCAACGARVGARQI